MKKGKCIYVFNGDLNFLYRAKDQLLQTYYYLISYQADQAVSSEEMKETIELIIKVLELSKIAYSDFKALKNGDDDKVESLLFVGEQAFINNATQMIDQDIKQLGILHEYLKTQEVETHKYINLINTVTPEILLILVYLPVIKKQAFLA